MHVGWVSKQSNVLRMFYASQNLQCQNIQVKCWLLFDWQRLIPPDWPGAQGSCCSFQNYLLGTWTCCELPIWFSLVLMSSYSWLQLVSVDRNVVSTKVFSTFLAAMVLPAWKWYILPMLYQFHNAHNEHSHALVEEPTKKPKALLHRLGSEISMISDEIKNPRLLSRLGSEISMLSDEMKNPRLLKRRGSEISTTSDDAKGWKCFSREGSVSLLTA